MIIMIRQDVADALLDRTVARVYISDAFDRDLYNIEGFELLQARYSPSELPKLIAFVSTSKAEEQAINTGRRLLQPYGIELELRFAGKDTIRSILPSPDNQYEIVPHPKLNANFQ